jgi:hypothetical protein
LPGREAHPEVVQCTAEFHHQIANALLPQADPVFDDTTTLAPEQVDIILQKVEQAEMDEMWSFVGSKSQQRWLWHAIDHHTGQILAYVFGTREDETFLKLKE